MSVVVDRVEKRPFVTETCYRESEHVSFSDGRPLLETLEFFEISHSSYQSLNF